MKLLTIGSERNLFNPSSDAAKRILEYSELVDELYIIVFTQHGFNKVDLSDKVHVYPTNSFSKLNYFFDALNFGSKICVKEKIDVVSAQDPFETSLIGDILKRRYKVGLNIQMHGDFFSCNYYKNCFLDKFRFKIAKKVLPRADSIRVVSQRIAESLKQFNINQDKIINVPIFVDHQVMADTLVKHNLHNEYPGKFVILSAGRLVKEKNIDLLIKSFEKVVEKHPESVLVIVGSGVEEKNLKLKTKNLSLSEKVFFKGWSDDLGSYYKTADLFVVSSDCEGYNRTVIEAMACGLPIVMTDVGLAGEIVKDGQNGLVVKTNDVDGLTEAISQLIKDDDMRCNFSEKGLATVQDLPLKDENLALYLKSWEMTLKGQGTSNLGQEINNNFKI